MTRYIAMGTNTLTYHHNTPLHYSTVTANRLKFKKSMLKLLPLDPTDDTMSEHKSVQVIAWN